MIKAFVFLMLISICGLKLRSQIDNKQKNQVYLELGGPAIIASVNYERVLIQWSKLSIAARIGIGSNRITDFNQTLNPDVSIPLEVLTSVNLNSTGTFKLKFGLGNTFNSTVILSSELKTKRLNSQNVIYANWTSLSIKK
ncbi:MAG TPA: hypothetical protein EYG86_07390 [Crocinitomicaceae bacterium]|nr:hypothetical protein [Crocinitomicaceae bacterium]